MILRILKWLGILFGGLLFLMLLSIAILYFSTAGDYSVPATVDQNPELPQITFNGYTFHSETIGNPSNPVVIALHGGPGGDYAYLRVLDRLSDEYLVVYYDQRSSGLSSRLDPEAIQYSDFVEDLNAFVDHYGHQKPVYLIGHSWGAMLASAYIGKYPNKVEKAVLAEPGFLDASFLEPFMKMAPTFDVIPIGIMTWFRSLHIDTSKDKWAGWDYVFTTMLPYMTPGYFCPGSIPPVQIKRFGFACFVATSGRLMDDEAMRKSISFHEGVEKFQRQVLFLASSCNVVIGEAHQRQQMKVFPHARLEVLKDCGHMMLNEKPEESLRIIRDYFKS